MTICDWFGVIILVQVVKGAVHFCVHFFFISNEKSLSRLWIFKGTCSCIPMPMESTYVWLAQFG